jgi:hypothetical protein
VRKGPVTTTYAVTRWHRIRRALQVLLSPSFVVVVFRDNVFDTTVACSVNEMENAVLALNEQLQGWKESQAAVTNLKEELGL